MIRIGGDSAAAFGGSSSSLLENLSRPTPGMEKIAVRAFQSEGCRAIFPHRFGHVELIFEQGGLSPLVRRASRRPENMNTPLQYASTIVLEVQYDDMASCESAGLFYFPSPF